MCGDVMGEHVNTAQAVRQASVSGPYVSHPAKAELAVLKC